MAGMPAASSAHGPARRFTGRPHNHATVATHRPARVLVECGDGAAAFARMQVLHAAGYEVSWCPGPDGHPVRRCPLINGAECPLVERADVVLSSLGLQHEAARLVLEAADLTHPELPVVVETSDSSAEEWTSVVGSHLLVSAPATGDDLVTAVTAALAAGAVTGHEGRLDH
jgi:hypothetical protein